MVVISQLSDNDALYRLASFILPIGTPWPLVPLASRIRFLSSWRQRLSGVAELERRHYGKTRDGGTQDRLLPANHFEAVCFADQVVPILRFVVVDDLAGVGVELHFLGNSPGPRPPPAVLPCARAQLLP